MSDAVDGLRSLSPEYIPAQHGEYVSILSAELQKAGTDAPRNIALTGHYGSGKSSVLVETQRQLTEAGVKVINLSLPSLGVGDARLQTNGEVALDKTNLIQKEIVKQLLYRRKPSDTPASRYNRLDTFQRGPAYRRAAGAGVGLAGIALLSDVPKKVRDSLPADFWSALNHHLWSHLATTLQWLSLLLVFGLGLGAVVWAQRLFQQRIRLTELAAGPAKVTLSDQSTSYFDEYLDEIVYFFQNSGTAVVIFEDLDRFKDPHIFETLRELNLLLNNAEQTGAEPIRFVYAIRDSIFEQLDVEAKDVDNGSPAVVVPVSNETRRLMSTNRTKFFDLVVPMVPFISHRTSRELIAGQLASVEVAQRPGPGVIDLVSVHLTDMRLIKNICNEYDVFRRRILKADGLDGLTPDRLFATIVYKNVYLGDYEKIRNGSSLLDDLYGSYREWVSSRAAAARSAESTARMQLQRVSQNAIAARSKKLGERLQVVLAAHHPRPLDPSQARVILEGTPYTWDQLLRSEFWRVFLKTAETLSVARAANFGAEQTVSFEDAQALMGISLASQEWETVDRAEWRTKMVAASAEGRAVAQASLTDALAETTKLFPYGGADLSLAMVADQLFEGAAVVVDLLMQGFIDENFTLYVTQFPGQGSASAMNFILKAVQPNVMDIEYHFGTKKESNTADIDAVVQAEGIRLFEGKSVYNIELFDHLLASTPTKLNEPIRRLATSADNDQEFIKAYLTSGQEQAAFVERLSSSWSGVFGLLLSQDLDDRGRSLLDAAIMGADPDDVFDISDEQRAFIIAALPRLRVVTGVHPTERAKSIARVLAQLAVKTNDIAKVAEPVRSEMVALGVYEISRANLQAILGADDQLSLDKIKGSYGDVYRHMLDHLAQYLAAIQAPTPVVTVAGTSRFAEILTDVENSDPGALTEVADGAAEGCMLDDLSALNSDDWPDIARAHRLRLTVPLVTQYEAVLGLDNALVEYLGAARAFEITDGEPGRLELAIKVLNSRALEDDAKMALLGSLSLTRESVTASALEKHAHSLMPRLVGGGWIADDEDAFACLGADEWPVKKALIEASKEFPDYMTALTLSPRDLQELASPSSSDAVKEVLLREYDTFESTFAKHGATALATWIAAKGYEPPVEVLVSLATTGMGLAAIPIIKLLGTQASSADRATLLAVLNALGDPYNQLTSPGHGRKKVPNHPGMGAVLSRLQDEHIVSKYDEKPSKSRYEISKRLS